MTPFIHICQRDEGFFNKWLKHARNLWDLPDMIVWAEPGVSLDHAIDYRFQSPCGYPEVTTHIWHEALTAIGGPLLYLEPDAWPCATNWYEALYTEYLRAGKPGALVTSSCHPPHDLVGGIGVYDASKLPLDRNYTEFRREIPDGAAFDWWVAQHKPAKTPLIRHSYGIYQNGEVVGYHAFNSQAHFERMCHGAAIFHKDAFGTVARWAKSGRPVITSDSAATPAHVSETSKHRDWFLPYTQGSGLDVGFGGDPLVPHAITFDMPRPYTSVGNAVQHLGGDARRLPFKEATLDWVYSSHLIEDFTYTDQQILVATWARVLKIGGRLLLLAPDQQRFLAHCAKTGQPVNDAHKEADYSLANFKRRVLKAGNFHTLSVLAEQDFDDYSWGMVLQKTDV